MEDDFRQAVEIIPNRYAVCFVKHPDAIKYSSIAAGAISYCIDDELLYEPFYADFGPLNLGKTYRFCEHTKQLLQEAEKRGKKLFLYTGPQPQARANAAVLVGIFQVLYLNRSPDDAYAPLAGKGPYMPFRDASCGIPTFNLQPIDCIRGIAKARDVGFIDASGGNWRFDVAEYEHYEQVENGDLNWILPGKLLAFSGPAARPTDYVGFRAMTPEDYWEYFRRKDVQAIVRLNKKVYEARRFTAGGFQHHELYFPDGSCPSQDILLHFLDVAERTPGCLAIHCKAGLGRTGVLICSYLMKHYRFTAEEVIGYIRVCRPGSVIGPQQGFIKDIQHIMWVEGDAYRATHGPNPPTISWGVTPAAASIVAAAAAAAASKGSASSNGSSNSSGSVCNSGGACSPPATSAVSISLLVDATNGASRGNGSVEGTPVAGRVAALAQTFNQRDLSLSSASSNSSSSLAAPATPLLDKSMSDLSLKQLRDHLSAASNGSNGNSSNGSSQHIARSNSSGSSSRAARSGITPQQLFAGSISGSSTAGSTGPLTSGLVCRPSTSQSLLLRHTSAATGAAAAEAASAAAANNLTMYRTRGASTQQKERVAGGSSGGGSNAAAAGAAGALCSSREAAIGALLNGSIASLRATLHTDKVSAATRPKVVPDGVISQSSDFIEAGWRLPVSGSNGSSRPQSTVARVLAPNGQPRKVPAAALAGMVPPPAAVTTSASSKGGLLRASQPTTPVQQLSGRLSAYYSSR